MSTYTVIGLVSSDVQHTHRRCLLRCVLPLDGIVTLYCVAPLLFRIDLHQRKELHILNKHKVEESTGARLLRIYRP